MNENEIPHILTNGIKNENIYSRLDEIRESKYLDNRIFIRISENMSYEIFKYMSSTDLLEIRASKLGGYQLTSNMTLRARIKNYMKVHITPLAKILLNVNINKRIFQQIGEIATPPFFNFIKGTETQILTQNFKFIPFLHTLNLGKEIFS